MSSANVVTCRLLFVCVVVLCIPVYAQRKSASRTGPLSFEDALKRRGFAEMMPIEFSPDGKWLAYTVKDNQRSRRWGGLQSWAATGVPLSAIGTDVCLSNIETAESKCLGSGTANSWLTRWSPDGHYLAFLSDRDGSGQARLWLWDRTKDVLHRVSDLDLRSRQIEWTPDSKGILVTIVPVGMSRESYVREVLSPDTKEDLEIRQPGSTAVLYRPQASSDVGATGSPSGPFSLKWFLGDLVLVDVNSGRSKLLVRGHKIARFLPSGDGLHAAYTSPRRFETAGSQQILFDFGLVDVNTGEGRILAAGVRLGFEGEFSWSPDSEHLGYCTYGALEPTNSCYVIETRHGRRHNVTQALPPLHFATASTLFWSEKGDVCYLVANGALWRSCSENDGEPRQVAQIPLRRIVRVVSGAHNVLWAFSDHRYAVAFAHDDKSEQDSIYRIDLVDGSTTKMLERNQCYTCTNAREGEFSAVSSTGKVAYYSEEATHDSDLWAIDPHSLKLQQVTHLNPQLEKYHFGPVKLVSWMSDDGEDLKGVLLLPPDYRDGQRYPMIAFVYGGARLSDSLNRFGAGYYGPFNLQLFATRGYAVLLPDVPQRLGTPMQDIAKAVLPGINKLISMGIVDPDRLGVMGHSYGGYTTLALITQTNRFKAAVSVDGVGDLVSSYGQMSETGTAYATAILETGQGKTGGTIWQVRDRYVENSPLFYFDRINTPVLLIHGAEDETVAPFLSDEMFVALRRLGKTVEYVKYEGEGHSPLYWSYANQLDYCTRLVTWFDSLLKQNAQ